MIRVAVSGGFDPLHIGHIKYFEEAKKLGDKLIVILNTDDFLIKKKGYVFMPLENRKKIIESLNMVDEVIVAIDRDMRVIETLKMVKPDIFAKGGDRTLVTSDVRERQLEDKIGMKCVWGIGGFDKPSSSSDLVYNAIRRGYVRCCIDLLVHKENQVLLGLRNNEPDKNKWSVFGGALKHGESFEDGVNRKAIEELGINVIIERQIGIYNFRSEGMHDVCIAFLVTPSDNASIKLDNQHSKYKWFRNIDKSIANYARNLIIDGGIL